MPWRDAITDDDGYDDDDSDWRADDDDDSVDTHPCPMCSAEVYADTPSCPRCGHYFTDDDPKPLNATRPWWVIFTAALILGIYGYLMLETLLHR